MHNNSQAGGGGTGVAASLGAVLGPALQVQQAALWPALAYGALAGAAAVATWGVLRGFPVQRWRSVAVVLACAALSFALCGLRAVQFTAQGLSPALEGRDIAVTGTVGAMPQRSEAGLRFRFEVTSAQASGEPVRLPPELYLSWYGGSWPGASGLPEPQRDTPEVRAGEQWQFTVRLKAPHGGLNPYGFDFELWLWEQGLQATGYVRAGPKDAPPQRLGSSWRHPVERARQAVRDAIYQRVTDRQVAGLLAALVVGDQNAIDRADWDVFRATGASATP